MSQLSGQSAKLDGAGLRQKLQEHFGFHQFRPGQAEAVQWAVDGRDTIVLMPTGSGKSLCFQLPALALVGTTIVVSPLISLIKDQVDALRRRGVSVAEVDSSISDEEEREALAAIEAGRVDFVYTTPERMGKPEFRALLKTIDVDLFVVDEAHCVSHWGHDFRPEYLGLDDAIRELGHPTVLALTATATIEVIDDIRRQLGLGDAELIALGIDRPNLRLSAFKTEGEIAKRTEILRVLREVEGSGIIYTATVKAVKELSQFLQDFGVDALAYHGQLGTALRSQTQDRFMSGEVKVIVATNAFGLGIDKADVRFVIHHHAPGTVEAYYQEAGRAGRDGLPAECVLLYDPSDKSLHRFFQAGRYPTGEELVNAHHALKRLADLGETPTFERLRSISPVPKSRLKQALNLFKSRGVVTEEEGLFTLVVTELTMDELHRMAGDYRERDEQDLLKIQRMLEYAEARDCRWDFLARYFDLDGPPTNIAVPCGHCDNCPKPG